MRKLALLAFLYLQATTLYAAYNSVANIPWPAPEMVTFLTDEMVKVRTFGSNSDKSVGVQVHLMVNRSLLAARDFSQSRLQFFLRHSRNYTPIYFNFNKTILEGSGTTWEFAISNSAHTKEKGIGQYNQDYYFFEFHKSALITAGSSPEDTLADLTKSAWNGVIAVLTIFSEMNSLPLEMKKYLGAQRDLFYSFVDSPLTLGTFPFQNKVAQINSVVDESSVNQYRISGLKLHLSKISFGRTAITFGKVYDLPDQDTDNRIFSFEEEDSEEVLSSKS